MDLRSFLFKKRSYTPIPMVLTILYFSHPNYPFSAYGSALIIVGELIRFSAVRHAGGRTRTTKVGANSLCTSGPYSRTRNPLYIGNLFIYSGAVLFSGGIYMFQLLAMVILYFVFQYSMIISLEEEKLSTVFGQEYSKYKNNVPRIIPLIIPWDNETKLKPDPILKTLKTEKRTLQNIFLLVFIIISKPYIVNFTI
ncbi:MAG: methyltransferase family protein [Candidatus Neomarinimicrobiota bacterium]